MKEQGKKKTEEKTWMKQMNNLPVKRVQSNNKNPNWTEGKIRQTQEEF